MLPHGAAAREKDEAGGPGLSRKALGVEGQWGGDAGASPRPPGDRPHARAGAHSDYSLPKGTPGLSDCRTELRNPRGAAGAGLTLKWLRMAAVKLAVLLKVTLNCGRSNNKAHNPIKLSQRTAIN